MNKIIAQSTPTFNDTTVYFKRSPSAPNQHILVTGTSGAQKSTAAQSICLQEVAEGRTAISINSRNCIDHENMFKPIRTKFERYAKVIRVDPDHPIHLPLLTTTKEENETRYNVEVNRLASMLSNAGGLTPAQNSRLLKALTDTTFCNDSKYSYHDAGIKCIGDYLQAQESATADNVYSKLSALFSYNLIRYGNDLEETGVLYEIDLNGLPANDQDTVANFLLEYILDDVLSKRFAAKGGLTLYLDEAQNYNFTKGSALFHLLNESRKTNTRLILVATALDNKAKVTGQAHFRISFRTGSRKETEEIVAMSDPKLKTILRVRLPRLNAGECLMQGDYLCCDGQGNTLDSKTSQCVIAYTYFAPSSESDDLLTVNGSN